MEHKWKLLERFIRAHPASAAREVERTEPSQAAAVFRALAPPLAAELLLHLAPDRAIRCLEGAPAEHGALVLSVVPLGPAAAVLRRTTPRCRDGILDCMEKGRVDRSLRRLLAHPPGTAGALMDPLVLAFSEHLTALQALDLVRSNPLHAMYYLYVLGDAHRLVGVVNLRELMLAEPNRTVASIMRENPDSLYDYAARESIVSHPGWRRAHALPVVDGDGTFLGVVRYETLRDVEAELGRTASAAGASETAAALAELYGIGLSGLFEWAAAAVGGPETRGRRSGRLA